MIVLEEIPDLNSEINKKNMNTFKNHMESGKHSFLFLYMDGCGPCNSAKESWKQIKDHVSNEHLSNNDILLAQINKDLFSEMENIGSDPMGFPTLRYINRNNNHIDEYESGRSPQDFAMWIDDKVKKLKPARRNKKNNKSAYKKTKNLHLIKFVKSTSKGGARKSKNRKNRNKRVKRTRKKNAKK